MEQKGRKPSFLTERGGTGLPSTFKSLQKTSPRPAHLEPPNKTEPKEGFSEGSGFLDVWSISWVSRTGREDARLKVKIIQWFRCFYLDIWSFCSPRELESLACLTVFPTFQNREIRDAEQKTQIEGNWERLGAGGPSALSAYQVKGMKVVS